MASVRTDELEIQILKNAKCENISRTLELKMELWENSGSSCTVKDVY